MFLIENNDNLNLVEKQNDPILKKLILESKLIENEIQ